jgi:hypothetical protein
MNMNIYVISGLLIIPIIILLFFFGMILYSKNKKDQTKKEANYRVFYYLGIIWLPFGLVFMISVNIVIELAFIALGSSYSAIGLANKDKWKKEEKEYEISSSSFRNQRQRYSNHVGTFSQ